MGYRTALITDVLLSERRSSFRQFFCKINSGIARINLPCGSLKLVHTLPACFVIGMASVLILSLFYPLLLLLPLAYSLIVFIDSLLINKSISVALYSIAASWIQLIGYGTGFLSAVWRRLILKKGEFKAFEKKFYK